MQNLRDRIVSYAEKAKKLEEMNAELVGVFDQNAQSKREDFEALVERIVKPAFEEFKAALRQIGRDAAIVSELTHNPVQSITLVLVDRYLKFNIGKTLQLVNLKEDVTQQANTKYYKVYRSDDIVCVTERAVCLADPVNTAVSFRDITPQFLENDLGRFFERAYPATT